MRFSWLCVPGKNTAFIRHDILQRQCVSVLVGIYRIKDINILGSFLFASEMHQYLICYPPPNAFLMH